MKKKLLSITLCLVFALASIANDNLRSDFKTGNPGIKSINALSFGPEGILFIGDSESAKVFAIDTKDLESRDQVEDYNIPNFDNLIAVMLGTTVENITITDMAVNPISKSL